MVKFQYKITDEQGIHARPAGELVKTAKGFESAITVEKNGKTADAKKILGLMGLGVKNDEEITIAVDGSDEVQAAETIEKFLRDKL